MNIVQPANPINGAKNNERSVKSSLFFPLGFNGMQKKRHFYKSLLFQNCYKGSVDATRTTKVDRITAPKGKR